MPMAHIDKHSRTSAIQACLDFAHVLFRTRTSSLISWIPLSIASKKYMRRFAALPWGAKLGPCGSVAGCGP